MWGQQPRLTFRHPWLSLLRSLPEVVRTGDKVKRNGWMPPNSTTKLKSVDVHQLAHLTTSRHISVHAAPVLRQKCHATHQPSNVNCSEAFHHQFLNLSQCLFIETDPPYAVSPASHISYPIFTDVQTARHHAHTGRLPLSKHRRTSAAS